MATGSPRSVAWSSSQAMTRVRIPRRRSPGETPTPVIPAAPTVAPPGTVKRNE
jgi:hypothetical protein